MVAYTNTMWSNHILDILLVGWIVFGILVAVGLHFYALAFGPFQGAAPAKSRLQDGGSHTVVQTSAGESIMWFNSALNWLYLHYHSIPEFIPTWIVSLNEQITKLGGPVQVKLEQIISSTLPPKVTNIYSEPGPKDTFIIRAVVQSRDLSFKVFASQHTADSLKLTNCVANILQLRGGVKLKLQEMKNDIEISLCFDGRPDVKVNMVPQNPHQDPTDVCDLGIVEELIRNAICLSSIKLRLSQILRGDEKVTRPTFSPQDPVATTESSEREITRLSRKRLT